MSTIIRIKGGAGAQEAAAISAAIAHAEAEAEARSARRPTPPRPSPWIQAGRPRESHAALPSDVYDSHATSLGTEGPEE